MKLYLIDGYGFVFRAFHSLPPLTKADGTPIGCVYGFTNMLYKLLENHEADYIAVVLDSGSKNFRHEAYPEYKANRPTPPNELIVQFPVIRDVIEAFNVKTLENPLYEADDLIAAYAKAAAAQGYEVKIISSDKDLMQLINDNIKLFDPLKNIDISYEQVKAKLGVLPHQVSDYLALVGDSSDNIPGVKGIGAKTAADLLAQFGSLENIYNRLAEVSKERIKNLLIEGKESAILSKSLVDLHRSYELECNIEELKVKNLDNQKLHDFLIKQGFKSLLSRFEKHIKASPTADSSLIPATLAFENVEYKEPEFIEFKEIDKIEKLFHEIEKNGKIAIYWNTEAFYFSYANRHFFIKLGETKAQASFIDFDDNTNITTILKAFQKVFEASYIKKIFFESKTIYKKFYELGIELNAFEDIGIMQYSLATGKFEINEENLIKEHFEQDVKFNSAALVYLYEKILSLLAEKKLLSLYELIDRPLSTVLANMELKGVKIDALFLQQLSLTFRDKLTQLEYSIFKEAGKEFLIASPKQLGEVLFENLGIPGGKKSKAGTYGTNAEVLEKLSEQGFTIADKVLEWRQFSKLINTYTEALPKAIDPKTKRVHTTFEATKTSTSRLSSHDPNLQNIPIRTDEGQQIRKAFIAEEGNLLISADYSQIELRLLADIANIKEMKDAFMHDKDIHAITASQIFGIEESKVDSHLRRKAKTINFGIIYGISAFGLARRLDIPNYEAKAYIDLYFKQYPGIKEFMDKAITYARSNGFVKSLFGRECYINGINDRNYSLRGFAERAAINAPLQATASDIIRKAMVNLPKEVKKTLVLQIHDELLFEVKENLVDKYSSIIKKVMESSLTLSVPLSVNISAGKQWGE